MKNIFLILLIALLTGCVTQEKCYRLYPPQVTEKVVNETVTEIHDSIITVPADSSWLKALIDCDKAGEAYLASIEEIKTGKSVKPRIIFKDKYLYVQCQVDSQIVYVYWKEKYVKESNNITIEPKAIITNELTQWQIFQMWLGRILLAALVVYFGYKFVKNKFKIL